jgi:dipeptidyl aminopeptidase/acylaminoacyl peptidase
MWIAFDSVGNGAQGVYVISAMGGTPRALAMGGSENSVPSWSRDGKWIYFGSNRSGQDQVWKVPVDGGQPMPVTQQGGFAALESPDGKTLYYAKTRFENPEIWRMPANGGTETIFSRGVRPKSWASWSVSEGGIFFCPPEAPSERPIIDFYDFGTRLTRQISLLDRSPFWLSSTPNGREVFITRPSRMGAAFCWWSHINNLRINGAGSAKKKTISIFSLRGFRDGKGTACRAPTGNRRN